MVERYENSIQMEPQYVSFESTYILWIIYNQKSIRSRGGSLFSLPPNIDWLCDSTSLLSNGSKLSNIWRG
jgi:hypothetical protein